MTDNTLYAKSRRVTRVHREKNGEMKPTHFFVSEDGWADFIVEVATTEGWSIEHDYDSPYAIDGTTSYGPIQIIYEQFTLWTKEE